MNKQTKTKLLRHFTSQGAIAKALKVSQPAVSQWFTGSRKVPVSTCVQIEALTNNLVTRKDLRSDWVKIWPELKGK